MPMIMLMSMAPFEDWTLGVRDGIGVAGRHAAQQLSLSAVHGTEAPRVASGTDEGNGSLLVACGEVVLAWVKEDGLAAASLDGTCSTLSLTVELIGWLGMAIGIPM